jgi:5,5'-dehydrodivanillate O-demethylase
MLSVEENARLTQVGPGTPMGDVMRRYWQPIAALPELDENPILGVRVLGESLTLFRTEKGALGLVQERCPHRGVALTYGIQQEDGIRCAYHGWYFNTEGQCLAQPYDDAENPDNTFKDRIRITSYQVQAVGGMVWAYLGPSPAPMLPPFEHFVEDRHRSIRKTLLPCNWLQCIENGVDPAHFEWLHANRLNYTAKLKGLDPVMKPGKTMKLAFDVWEFGIYKRRIVEGDPPETSPDWQIGHPILFPHWVAVGPRLQFNVPVDDEHTMHYEYTTKVTAGNEPLKLEYEDEDWQTPEGKFILDTILGTDYMAWVTQGKVAVREEEHLGLVDKGVILFRQVMSENISRVQRGEDVFGTVRETNREPIHIRSEADMGGGWRGFHGGQFGSQEAQAATVAPVGT